MMRFEQLLFDLDGTLIDPAEGITKSVVFALGHFGIKVADWRDLYPFIGPPLRDSFRDFYGFTPAQAEKATLRYRQRYSEKGVFENTLYEGITDLLESLTQAGKMIYLATSKPTVYAVNILEQHDMSKYFSFVGGAELDGSRDSKADVIRYLISSACITDTTRTVMIGDRHHDIAGAKQTGLKSIGVTYGYGSSEELASAGADHIVDSVSALGKLLLE